MADILPSLRTVVHRLRIGPETISELLQTRGSRIGLSILLCVSIYLVINCVIFAPTYFSRLAWVVSPNNLDRLVGSVDERFPVSRETPSDRRPPELASGTTLIEQKIEQLKARVSALDMKLVMGPVSREAVIDLPISGRGENGSSDEEFVLRLGLFHGSLSVDSELDEYRAAPLCDNTLKDFEETGIRYSLTAMFILAKSSGFPGDVLASCRVPVFAISPGLIMGIQQRPIVNMSLSGVSARYRSLPEHAMFTDLFHESVELDHEQLVRASRFVDLFVRNIYWRAPDDLRNFLSVPRVFNGQDRFGLVQFVTILAACYWLISLLSHWMHVKEERDLLNRAETFLPQEMSDRGTMLKHLDSLRGRLSIGTRGDQNAVIVLIIETYSALIAEGLERARDALREWEERLQKDALTRMNTTDVFIWLIPSLGFIGTIIGIAEALGSAHIVMGGQGEEKAERVGALTSTLGVAFDTTLIALLVMIAPMIFRYLARNEREAVVAAAASQVSRLLPQLIGLGPAEYQHIRTSYPNSSLPALDRQAEPGKSQNDKPMELVHPEQADGSVELFRGRSIPNVSRARPNIVVGFLIVVLVSSLLSVFLVNFKYSDDQKSLMIEAVTGFWREAVSRE